MKGKSFYAITKLILKSHKNKFSCSLITKCDCRSITLTCLRYKHDVAISVTKTGSNVFYTSFLD